MTGAGRVVVIGDAMIDILARHAGPIVWGSDTEAQIATRHGGAGSNVAHWLAHLGVPVTLSVAVGDDAAGHSVVAALEAAGIHVTARYVPHVPTGTLVVLVAPDGERTFIGDQGANAHHPDVDVPADARHLHVSGYVVHAPSNREVASRAIAAARIAGVTVSADPASTAPLRQMGADVFWAVVRGADLVIATLDEADALTGATDAAGAMDALHRRAPAVVLKLGSEGAWYAGPDGEARCAPAPPPGPVLNTAGAGDAFAAGFLAGWGRERPERALQMATQAAAEAVTLLGARPGEEA